MIVSEENDDAGVYYAFRDKKTKLYLGYDGFDTDFAKGISEKYEPCKVEGKKGKKWVERDEEIAFDTISETKIVISFK